MQCKHPISYEYLNALSYDVLDWPRENAFVRWGVMWGLTCNLVGAISTNWEHQWEIREAFKKEMASSELFQHPHPSMHLGLDKSKAWVLAIPAESLSAIVEKHYQTAITLWDFWPLKHVIRVMTWHDQDPPPSLKTSIFSRLPSGNNVFYQEERTTFTAQPAFQKMQMYDVSHDSYFLWMVHQAVSAKLFKIGRQIRQIWSYKTGSYPRTRWRYIKER